MIDREGNGKLCSEFKFSYIGKTGSENFCSVLSFMLLRRFEIMYIYAKCNGVKDRELVAGLV